MMSKKSIRIIAVSTLAVAGLLAGCSSNAATPTAAPTEAKPAAWSYSGDTGPADWGSLDTAYALCADGTAQTPIDVVNPVATDLENITFNYAAGEAGVFNNGHTVEAEPMVEGEDSISLDGVDYPFLQFHFHAPSEHVVNGEHYAVEVHFVHKTEVGKIAVVGIFVKEGEANAAWQPFVDAISGATDNPEDSLVELDWSTMLPAIQTRISYDGSLTTPGCAEGVKWNVMSDAITMSAEQIAAFTGAYADNSRPVQALNGREVLIDSTP
jgi:carbonic anhydrase